MSREMVGVILERAEVDLAFRRRYEQAPDEALAPYSRYLTADEWQILLRYPAYWRNWHSVQSCPHCGTEAMVSKAGEVVRCPNCRPEARWIGTSKFHFVL